jgi:hypothetical protein
VMLASHEADRAQALAGRIVTVAGGTVLPAGPDSGRARPVSPAGARVA